MMEIVPLVDSLVSLQRILLTFFPLYHIRLAIALAQIIALRSKQSNFQLIMITHDEEFVSMMKTELAAHSNFSMPEKFFRVHREMEAGGRYYSKITAPDWEEIV
jgi:DNA repair protein RAD50